MGNNATHKYSYENKNKLFMAVFVFVSVTGHRVIVGIYSYFLFYYLSSIPFAISKFPNW